MVSRLTRVLGRAVALLVGASALPFDADWRFQRGDNSGWSQPGLDDSGWRRLDVPHDWGIEDLPPRDQDPVAPVLSVRYGRWRFHKGDNSSWAQPGADDADWEQIEGGQDWRVAAKYSDKAAVGWYRRTVDANELLRGSNATRLGLGVVSGTDETYVNGQQVGSTGRWGQPGCADYETWRNYLIPQGLLKPTGNVVAVRAFTQGGAGTDADGTYPGGLYDDPKLKDADVRSGPFDASSSLNGRSYGYTVGGTSWYRKHFKLECGQCAGSVVRLQFDGVYMNSDMWINGHFLGNHPYGYTSFAYQLPAEALAAAGQENVLAVRVNNAGRNSRWYSGSGIFRHTFLSVLPGLHFGLWGLHVATPAISPSAGQVALAVTLESSSTNAAGTVKLTLLTSDGSTAASGSMAVQGAGTSRMNLTVAKPALWSPDSPTLYTAVAELETTQQDYEEPAVLRSTFGFRTISFDTSDGFKINGVTTKLYGGCLHHDNGPLGSKAIDRAEERRVQLLKANGYNAIRTSHNPVSPAFLDACDREGVMVMDEAFDCWAEGKNTDDYHVWFNQWWQRDIASMVLRDRNHPSVIMWSIGNEIPMRATQAGYNLSHVLSDYVRSLDSGSGRAVTSAYPGVSDAADQFFAPLEVAGYNYSPQRYVSDHKRVPSRVMVGTESFPKDSFQMWDLAWQNSWVLGDFIWTSFDYIGESDIGFESESGDVDQCSQEPFPWHISFCGDIDNAGQQKPQAYYRRVLWGVSTIEMAVHQPLLPGHTEAVGGWGWPEERQSWSWPGSEGQNLTVNVYAKGGPKHSPNSSCTQVELYLNDKLVNRMPVGYSQQFTASSQVTYTPGSIKAVCLGGASNAALGVTEYKTAGPPARIELVADRSSIQHSRDDLSYVTAKVLDANGVLVPDAALKLEFSLGSGSAGEIAAVGNGDPQDISSHQANFRTTWRGKALVVLRPVGDKPGSIRLSAAYSGGHSGLPTATIEVTTSTKEATADPACCFCSAGGEGDGACLTVDACRARALDGYKCSPGDGGCKWGPGGAIDPQPACH